MSPRVELGMATLKLNVTQYIMYVRELPNEFETKQFVCCLLMHDLVAPPGGGRSFIVIPFEEKSEASLKLSVVIALFQNR